MLFHANAAPLPASIVTLWLAKPHRRSTKPAFRSTSGRSLDRSPCCRTWGAGLYIGRVPEYDCSTLNRLANESAELSAPANVAVPSSNAVAMTWNVRFFRLHTCHPKAATDLLSVSLFTPRWPAAAQRRCVRSRDARRRAPCPCSPHPARALRRRRIRRRRCRGT